jgi:AcrR family transcriptional regulator
MSSSVAKRVDGRSRRLGMSNAERSEQTRGQLLAAAAELFDQRGYIGTSLSDITDRLGMTKGALYFHFRSKEALAAAIVEAQYERWDPLAARVVGAGATRLDDLVALSYKVADAFRRDVVVRAGVRLQAERDLISADMPRPYVEWIKRVTKLAQAAKDNGELAPGVDPAALGNVIVGMFFGAQHISQALTGRRDLKRRLDQFWELMLPAIRATA